MCPHDRADTIRTDDCSTVLRRVTGPEAEELFVLCRPVCGTTDAGPQTEAIYRAILDLLAAEGASFESVIRETLFLRNLREDLEVVRDTRGRVLEEAGCQPCRPATAEIEQPPLNDGACLELSLHAVIPRGRQSRAASDIRATPACECPECAKSYARLVQIGDEAWFHAGNLYGSGGDAFEEASAMFWAAEDLLRKAGMSFHDVVRTWIYLRDIDRDYADFNRARREFFRQRSIDPSPASTGIGGGPVPDGHDLSLSVYAVQAPRPLAVALMSAPTLNDPGSYGSDFARGLKVVEANKTALHVSGTASVDEAGRTAHPENIEAQVDRMLVNISSLLSGQSASFRNVVSAVTYLKHPGDIRLLRTMFRERGFDGFPNALVAAPLCRSDLLCEAEVLAVLPRPPSRT
jgi:enamine deaminase RidA (YjgF/YER057c/UK114 family)